MSMFPKIATTGQLLHTGSKPDMGFAVRQWPSPGLAHRVGDCWTFWITDDPRNDDGNFSYIASYKCIESGNDDATWEKQPLPAVVAKECEFCGDPATTVERFDRPVLVCDACSASSISD